MVAAGGWAASQRLRVWWKRSTLPQVVGWLGREFFWVTPRRASSVSKPLRPPSAAGEAGGEDHPVVGQGGGGHPVGVAGLAEDVDHDRAGDPGVGGDRQGVAGVVIDPAQDLDVGAVGEAGVGEVGLPALVG